MLLTSPMYTTTGGAAYVGDSLNLLDELESESINLVMTSPPFALQREKSYGNVEQGEYVEWLAQFCKKVYRVLRQDGSFVLDLGGAYQSKRPIRSLYNFRVLIKLCDELHFQLAEDFYWHNPAKLPSPIEWVNKRKMRAKDSVDTIWWFCKSDFPKANISQVLVPYSDRMKKLHANPEKYYRPKKRPSAHDIGTGFANDNGGAIPPNLLQIPNTESNSQYLRLCKAIGVYAHPARFPQRLPEFFIKFLTEPGDLVLDIFGGSNTTGAAAESLRRRWLSFELSPEYLATSAFRFIDNSLSIDEVALIYQRLIAQKEMMHFEPSADLLTSHADEQIVTTGDNDTADEGGTTAPRKTEQTQQVSLNLLI